MIFITILIGTGNGSGMAETIAFGLLALYHWVSSSVSKDISAKTLFPRERDIPKMIEKIPTIPARNKAIILINIRYKIKLGTDYQKQDLYFNMCI